MPIKPTLRRNGMMLADVMVRFTVGANWLVAAVARDMASRSPEVAKRVEYSRKNVESLLRQELEIRGSGLPYLDDEEFQEDAWKVVQRLFPEMCK